MFVTAVVACARVSFRVLVWRNSWSERGIQSSDMDPGEGTLHDTTQSVENGLRREVLRWDKIDKVLLPGFLLYGAGLSHCHDTQYLLSRDCTFCRMSYTSGSAFSKSADMTYNDSISSLSIYQSLI